MSEPDPMDQFAARMAGEGAEVARLAPLPEFEGLPGLFIPTLDLVLAGVDLPDLAGPMMDLATIPVDGGRVETPRLDTFGISIATPNEVHLLKDDGKGPDDQPGSRLRVIFEAAFEDEHPAEWIEYLRQHRQVLLAVGAVGHRNAKNLYEWQQTWRVAVISLSVHAFPDGTDILGYRTEG